MIPKFRFDNLLTIEPTDAAGASDFLPFGYAGRARRLRLRHLVLPRDRGRAARGRGVADPKKDMPRGIIAAMMFLLVPRRSSCSPLRAVPGSDTILDSDNPLPLALREAYGGDTVLADFVNYVGLAGLVASFFSIIFAYSRQLFALSRAGYLPRWLSKTGRPQDAVPRTGRPRPDRLPARRHHRGRRAAHQHRRCSARRCRTS
jgi:ethanolamine permease